MKQPSAVPASREAEIHDAVSVAVATLCSVAIVKSTPAPTDAGRKSRWVTARNARVSSVWPAWMRQVGEERGDSAAPPAFSGAGVRELPTRVVFIGRARL